MTVTETADINAAVAEAFAFEVDKFPLTGPDGIRTPFYGLFRSDNGALVADRAVSRNYVPHTTEDVQRIVEAVGEAFGGVAAVRCGFRKGHFVEITPTRERRAEVFGTADSIVPRVLIEARYGGTGCFNVSMGHYRDVCRNLARLTMVRETKVKIRHSSTMRGRMDDLVNTVRRLDGAWDRIVETVRAMENVQVNMADFLREMYGEPEEGKNNTRHKRRTEAIFSRLLRERVATGRGGIDEENFMVSGWEAWNSVQGYIQHDKTRKGERRTNEISRAMSSLTDGNVIRAEEWILAQAH